MSLTILDYNDLVNGVDLHKELETAYGKDGLGVLVVKNVPKFKEYRDSLLPLARKFATLDENTKSKYVDEKSNWSFGWSHGKEKFAGKFDTSKGSYYNNPQYDEVTTNEELKTKYPSLTNSNIWPKDDIPEYESAFKNLGQLVVHVGELVAKQTDSWIHSLNKNYPKDKLYNTIKESKTCKARLLYYYPLSNKDLENFDDWCGWHYDHGSLTGLTKALFQDENGEITENKDKEAGLFIRNRKGDLVRAVWDDDMLAFQIGESAMIHSGGLCVATPHCVRGTTVPNISRSTFAVFMQPQYDVMMSPPEGSKIEDCKVNVLKEGMDFAHFTEKRLAEYY